MDWSLRSSITFGMPLAGPSTSPLAGKGGHTAVDDSITNFGYTNGILCLLRTDNEMNSVILHRKI
jgi:hypothetical protein